MESAIILSQMAQMFLMIFLGYFLRKTGRMDREFTAKMSTFLLNVAMPSLIIHSAIDQEGGRNLAEMGAAFAIAAGMYLILPVLSLFLVKVMRLPKGHQGVYAFMMTFSNTGLMGFPLVNAVYGSGAVFYAAIFNILFNISCYTIGVLLFHIGQDVQVKMSPKLFLTPGTILSLVAVVLSLVNWSFPVEIVQVTGSIGNMTTPAAMLCIGSTLASMRPREVLNDWRIYLFSLVKQVALPLLLLPLLRIVISNDYLRGITYLLLLMPVANTAVLFATEYGFDEKLAARGVFVSTVLSVATIPLLASML